MHQALDETEILRLEDEAAILEALSDDPAGGPASDLPSASDMGRLESRALHATLWTVIDYGASQAVRVLNSLLLTHLLAPQAFGEMMLLTTLIVGMGLLSDLGLEPNVIQSRRGDDPTFLNTAWTIQSIRGVCLWLGALLLAYPASRFYHDPQLLLLLPVLAFSVVLNGLNATGLLTLSRHLGVRRLFFIDFSTQLVALGVTVGYAWFHHTVWALVIGNLASNLYRLTLSHIPRVVPGLRNRFGIDRASFREIVHFGKWIILATALYFFASQADRLILGKIVDMTVLGLYGIAFQISDVPRSVINAFSQKVIFPFVSRISDLPRDQFRRQYLRYRLYTLLLGAFILSTMAVWGSLIILKIYPARYHDASWMIPILTLGLWHTLLYTTTRPTLFALGRSSYNAFGNGGYALAMVLGIPWAYAHFQLPGAIVAIAAGDLPLYLVTQFGAQREGIRPLRQDLLLTLAMLVLLALNFAIRRSF